MSPRVKKRERVEGGMWFSRGETRDLGEDREGGLHQIPVASVKSLNLPSLSFVIFKMWMIISLFRKQIFMELLRCA